LHIFSKLVYCLLGLHGTYRRTEYKENIDS